MTDQEINEAIAESVGWRDILPQNGALEGFRTEAATCRSFVPNYTGDLNAIHEVEMGLKGSKEDEHCEMADYQEHLCLVCGDGVEPLNVYDIDLIRATAGQRAEAYLRTIGKWKE